MTPRPSRKGDENALKALWREVFGDTDEYIDAFFQNVYQPGMASVIEEDGTVVAAAYAVPFGAVRYIFAVATKPEYRGRGYGRAVVFAATGGEPGVSLPGERDASVLVRAHDARQNGILPLKRAASGCSPEDHGGGIPRTPRGVA